jgi:hypothetical protein
MAVLSFPTKLHGRIENFSSKTPPFGEKLETFSSKLLTFEEFLNHFSSNAKEKL